MIGLSMLLGPRRIALLGAFTLATACVDPQTSFEDFKDRQQDGEGGGGGGGPVTPDGCRQVHPDEINGDWLLAVGTDLNPAKPMMALLTINAVQKDDMLEIELDAQPLDAKDRRTPVGGELPPMTILADTIFVIELARETTDGKANPILYGSPVESEITITGTVCSERTEEEPDKLLHFMCGTGKGEIFSPIPMPLEETVFGATRITDPQHYPEPIVIDCDGNLAEETE